MSELPEYLLAPAIIAFVFFMLGSVFMGIGLFLKLRTKNWNQTEGEIIKKDWFFPSMPDGTPSFRYTANDGVTYEKTSRVSQSPGISIGKKVTVFYDPENPQNGALDTFVQNGTLFSVLGGFFLGGSLIAFITFLYLYF